MGFGELVGKGVGVTYVMGRIKTLHMMNQSRGV